MEQSGTDDCQNKLSTGVKEKALEKLVTPTYEKQSQPSPSEKPGEPLGGLLESSLLAVVVVHINQPKAPSVAHRPLEVVQH